MKTFWQTSQGLWREKQYNNNTVYTGSGELLTWTGDIVWRCKEYYEYLLNPTYTLSVDEAKSEDSDIDSFIIQAEVTEVV